MEYITLCNRTDLIANYLLRSGMLNSKTRELMALQEEAAARLMQTKKTFMEGMRVAKEVKADLDYVHKRVMCVLHPCGTYICVLFELTCGGWYRNLQKKTQQKYPVEYMMARERIPPPSS